jgi:hypothetical protein
MCQHHEGNNKEARQAYDDARQWLKANRKAVEEDPRLNAEMRRFQAEAEQVLGVGEQAQSNLRHSVEQR